MYRSSVIRWVPVRSLDTSAKYGTKRLRKAVLIGTLRPYLVKAPDNPEGINAERVQQMPGRDNGGSAGRDDGVLEELLQRRRPRRTTGQAEPVMQANWTVAIGASPIGTLACVDAWITPFRKDIVRNDVPTMIIHGDDDRILPADVTSRRQAKMIKNVRLPSIKAVIHGIPWTHGEEINAELVPFLT